MINETYYTRDYERWITPINKGNDTYCLVFGKTANESKQRAQDLYKLMGMIDEPRLGGAGSIPSRLDAEV